MLAFPLSVLDLSPIDAGSSSAQALQNTLDLARHADQLGYTRYWLAEHHNTTMLASSSPEIMIAAVAQATTHMRVGSGGVMLPNHAPLKVAENFRLLEALYPGRIDLGIGRAPGTDPVTALALRRSQETSGSDDLPEQLAELVAFSGGGFPAGHPFRSVSASPADVALPPIWLLGSSGYSAQVAAHLGYGFAFAHHINPMAAVPAIDLYRKLFVPSKQLTQAKVILATSVVCADTDAEADDLSKAMAMVWFRIQRGISSPIPSVEEARAHFANGAEQAQLQAYRSRVTLGNPDVVHKKLSQLIEQTSADELMIGAFIPGHTARLRSYALLAEMFSLVER